MRDCLVCGVNHQGIQKRLLAEKNLTLEKAFEIALALEAADSDVKQLQKPPATMMYQTQGKSSTEEDQLPPDQLYHFVHHVTGAIVGWHSKKIVHFLIKA